MESLFTDFINQKPLRKYEPLIRFDPDGKPQPRKPFGPSPAIKEEEEPVGKPEPPEPSSISKTVANNEDLKRKLKEAPPAGLEPKKKQQKQTSIMSFFKKN